MYLRGVHGIFSSRKKQLALPAEHHVPCIFKESGGSRWWTFYVGVWMMTVMRGTWHVVVSVTCLGGAHHHPLLLSTLGSAIDKVAPR